MPIVGVQIHSVAEAAFLQLQRYIGFQRFSVDDAGFFWLQTYLVPIVALQIHSVPDVGFWLQRYIVQIIGLQTYSVDNDDFFNFFYLAAEIPCANNWPLDTLYHQQWLLSASEVLCANIPSSLLSGSRMQVNGISVYWAADSKLTNGRFCEGWGSRCPVV